MFLWSSYGAYKRQQQGEKRVGELAQELANLEKQALEKKAADKIGGKTPQETLALFIAAVEKGDYELASKYFVIERQAEELKSLQNSKKENIENVMGMLKKVRDARGAFENMDRYFVDEPIKVDFVRYPFGNWKIEEI
ncbi:MAG: hypothetical protein Q7R75_02920 [bacterium]|nr:hypothetical protein [bacterium]